MKAWAGELHKKKVKEFSFFPDAYTPMDEAGGFALPEVEMEFGGGEEKEEESKTTDSTPSWIKNISFTIAGVTIGGAAVYGLLGGSTQNQCPAAVVTQQTTKQPIPTPTTPVTTPTGSGTPPRTTGTAASVASSSSATSSTPTAGNPAPTGSAGGTI